jgi:hypothetical protein
MIESFKYVLVSCAVTLTLVTLCPQPTNSLNEWCNTTIDCQFKVGGAVHCTPAGCQCSDFHLPFQLFPGLGREECLPVAVEGPGAFCKYHEQCTFTMGQLALCSNESYPPVCKCHDTLNKNDNSNKRDTTAQQQHIHERHYQHKHHSIRRSGQTAVVYIRTIGNCIYRKKVGDPCSYDEECEMSIGKGSVCTEVGGCSVSMSRSYGHILSSNMIILVMMTLVVRIHY